MELEPLLIPYASEPHLGEGRALIFSPHPDDEVLGCGGAILAQSHRGQPVEVVVVTDGGGMVRDAETPAYVALRREESRAAAALLGYGEPEFWDYPDRGLSPTPPLVERIRSRMERSRPRFVLTPSLYERHPDHLALSLAVIEAFRSTRLQTALVFYEIGAPLHPNLLLDISRFEERKRRAIACFRSQLAQQDYARQVLALNVFRTYTLPPGTRLAEAYLRLERDDLEGNPEATGIPSWHLCASLRRWEAAGNQDPLLDHWKGLLCS